MKAKILLFAFIVYLVYLIMEIKNNAVNNRHE